MKSRIKRYLAALGLGIHRIPKGLPSGHILSRDLALVIGQQPGPVCIDGGAHHGDFTALVLNCLNRPSVHAFEPTPEVFSQLQTRHADSPGVSLFNEGLSDTEGELTLHLSSNAALNSFLPMTSTGANYYGKPHEQGQITARTHTLDRHAEQHQIKRIDLLKIDTQGTELQVLKGAEKLLKAGQIQSVLLEINFGDFYQNQAAAHTVMAYLHDHGMQLVEFYEKCRHGSHLSWCTALFTKRAATT